MLQENCTRTSKSISSGCLKRFFFLGKRISACENSETNFVTYIIHSKAKSQGKKRSMAPPSGDNFWQIERPAGLRCYLVSQVDEQVLVLVPRSTCLPRIPHGKLWAPYYNFGIRFHGLACIEGVIWIMIGLKWTIQMEENSCKNIKGSMYIREISKIFDFQSWNDFDRFT